MNIDFRVTKLLINPAQLTTAKTYAGRSTRSHPHIPTLTAMRRQVFGSIPLAMERHIEMKTETGGGFHEQATYL
jgi:hypothetical protein